MQDLHCAHVHFILTFMSRVLCCVRDHVRLKMLLFCNPKIACVAKHPCICACVSLSDTFADEEPEPVDNAHMHGAQGDAELVGDEEPPAAVNAANEEDVDMELENAEAPPAEPENLPSFEEQLPAAAKQILEQVRTLNTPHSLAVVPHATDGNKACSSF